MSVAINLLSDARQAKIKAKHLRRLITSLSVLVWLIVGAVIVLLLAALGAQKLQINDLNTKISSKTSQIQSTPNLTEALTAQQAMQSLPQLYNQRSGFRLFLPLLLARVPTDVAVNSVSTDASNTLTVTGTGSSAVSVNHFYEAVKAAGKDSPSGNYFTGVIVNGVSKDNTGVASFTLTASVSPGVFDAAE